MSVCVCVCECLLLAFFSLSRVWALLRAFDILSDQNDTKETWIYPVLRPGSVTVGCGGLGYDER